MASALPTSERRSARASCKLGRRTGLGMVVQVDRVWGSGDSKRLQVEYCCNIALGYWE